jgi:hypothetical protein
MISKGELTQMKDTVLRRSQRFFEILKTSTFRSGRRVVKMNSPGSPQAPLPEGSARPRVTFVGTFQDASAPNLIRALTAILFWSLLLGAVAFCHELWRLENNWRLGVA